MSGLSEAIGAIASTPVLLVASDFDGTLAPIVDHPDDASIDRRAWNALRALADLPHTHAAVVTGRARADVLERVPDLTGTPVSVVGSHGIEAGFTSVSLSADQAERLHLAKALLRVEAAKLPGALVETKPASVTLHVRMADPVLAAAAFERVTVGARHIGGLHMLSGDQVLELFVLTPGKDTAVNVLRHRSGATGVIFIGDDVTDESVFAQLRDDAVGVKVGSSATAADVRVGSQADVAGVLEDLLTRRRRWLAERRLVPITHHSILSDQRTVAVVDPEGSIVWACFPRLDSPPLFASMLDTPTRGQWSIRPADPTARVTTEYDGDSFVLRTRWHIEGRPLLTVTDYFDCTGGRPYQRAGRAELVRVIEGDGPATIRFAPRLDFGRLRTRIEVKPDGLEIDGWHDPIVLRSPGVPWRVIEEGPDQTAIADVDPSRGPVVLELRYGTASLRAAPIEESARRDHSRRFWSGWAGTLRTTRLYPDLVRRSALAIKSLCHGPTGAIAAAATTSLPEHLGGVRNWDYRYCWIRDACMSAAALVRIGNTGVALKLLDWLVEVVEQCESPERLRPLYTVSGNTLGPEAEISELTGYGHSRPVRIGNAASHQVQLDVFGPVVELVALMTDGGAPVTPEQWHLVEAMVKAVELRWEEADHGIWEIRGPKRHHVHSKTMCWFAVDRGLYVAEQAMGLERPDWVRLRDRIAKDVLDRGFNAEAGFFTAAYGETVADAASLAVGLYGLIPAEDPRFVATVEAIEHELRDGPAVHRYLGDDGLPGREGAWVICACWLVECLAMVGRTDEARTLLHKIAALAGPTGLMSEEWDAQHGIPLGNFPQAYSHLGLINAVMRLESLGLK